MEKYISAISCLGILFFASSAVSLSDSLESELTPKAKEYIQSSSTVSKQAALLTTAYLSDDKLKNERKRLTKKVPSNDIRAAALASFVLEGHKEKLSSLVKVISKSNRPDVFLGDILLRVPPSVKEQILDRAAQSKKLRPAVMNYLARSNNQFYEKLGDFLRSDNSKISDAAMKAIAQHPRPKSVEIAEGLLGESDRAVKLALRLSEWGNLSESSTGLIRAARHRASSTETKIEISKRLLQMGALKDPTQLVDYFFEAPSKRRKLGRQLLGAGIDFSKSRLDKALKQLKDKKAKGLIWEMKAAEGAVEQKKLEKMFTSTTFENRIYSVRAMGQLGKTSSIDMLGEALFEGNERIRYYAAKALGRIDSPDVIAPLKRSISKERKERIKLAVIDSLARVGTNKAIKALEFNINSSNDAIKRRILEAFQKTSAEIPESTISMRLSDRNSEIRMLAFETLYKRAPKTAIDRISSVIANPPMGFYNKILHFPNSPQKESLFENLIRQSDSYVAGKAFDQIERAPKQFMSMVRDAARDSGVSEDIRKRAIRLLSRFPSDQNQLLFGAVVRTENVPETVRRDSAWALVQYRDPGNEASFRGYLGHDDEAIQAIGVYGLASMKQ